MKIYLFLWIFFSQHMYSHACPFASVIGSLPDLVNVKDKIIEILSTLTFLPICMSVPEMYLATKLICGQELNNTALWASVIHCHRPIDDDFLRQSGEAQCPIPRHVQYPTDTHYSIEEVFFNICGFVKGNLMQLIYANDCLMLGDSNRNVPPHRAEVADVRNKWGMNKPCEIGKCVKALRILQNYGF